MNISRDERNSWYVPGKTNVEKQHLSEHETLQKLQRHALNNELDQFYELLKTIDGEDKKRDILIMCGIHRDKDALS